jgi:O-antigen ligase
MITRLKETDDASTAQGGIPLSLSLFSPSSWPARCKELLSVDAEGRFAARANLFLLFSLAVFALGIPHSIAVSQTSSTLGLMAWIVRDLAMRRFHFKPTPADHPLACFFLFTILSSLFSIEPAISLPKLKSLLLFGVIYLLSSNLSRRGVKAMAGLLIASSLVGVAFSISEKIMGRGMVVLSIAPASPLAGTELKPGDVIWMIGKKRVYSSAQAADLIRRRGAGEVVNVETLRDGDPVEITLNITEEIKTRPNPLGVESGDSSRRFRVSGFSRQFMTYAEQMQMLTMIAFGGIMAGIGLWRKRKGSELFKISGLLFLFFSAALLLTATRTVIVACLLAILIVSFLIGSRLAALVALSTTLILAGIGFYFIGSSRQAATVKFDDDSTSRRIAYMNAGLRVIPQHPLLGVGMDSHKRHWKEWGFPGDYVTHTHSTPIQLAMDRGVPALIGYGWFLGALFVMLRRTYRQSSSAGRSFEEAFSLGALGAVIAFSLSSIANYNFGDSEALMMLLFLVGLSMVQWNAIESR